MECISKIQNQSVNSFKKYQNLLKITRNDKTYPGLKEPLLGIGFVNL